MIKTLLTYLLLGISLLTPTSGSRSEVEVIIRSYFVNETRLDFMRYDIPEEVKLDIEKKTGQKFFKNFLYIWKVYSDDEFIATAVIDNVYGKLQPITFLVIVNSKGEVIASEIIKYREPYGGQIANKNWLKQFEGKNYSSAYSVGDDISTISGATISVNSITKGIRKITMLINSIGKDL
ncbi:MAG: FMN-binding protein [Ignavibacteria bacterium]|nr:FMN-binding protein [Ignavibacteria bacterium]